MLNDLGINGPSLLTFLVSFFLLFGLLTFILYKPVTKMLDERAAKIKDSLDQAERIKAESQRAEESLKAQIEAGRKEGQAIIAQATQSAERVKEEAKAEARKEADAIVSKAKSEIERERQMSFDQLRQEFADLVILAAEKVINHSIDKKAHHQLIEETLKEGTEPQK
jgi:F-type H+-transporting ATPase subunit b